MLEFVKVIIFTAADIHSSPGEQVATVRQKLGNAVRKGKAIDAERKQSIIESEARAARLAQAEQRFADLEEKLHHAAVAANSEVHSQLSEALGALGAVTAERDAAQAALERAAATQRDAGASLADANRQLDQSKAAAAAQAEGAPRPAMCVQSVSLATSPFWVAVWPNTPALCCLPPPFSAWYCYIYAACTCGGWVARLH